MSKTGSWGDKSIIYLHSNDERRNRRNCVNYRHNDGYCEIYYSKCLGSTHCKFYKTNAAKVIRSTPSTQPLNNEPTQNSIQKFEGVQIIDIQDIRLPRKSLTPPSPKKIDKLIKYYQENGVLDKPIVVHCGTDKYILHDRYLRYYVAKMLGITKIHARISNENDIFDKLLRVKDTKIRHKIYGIVYTENSDMRFVTLRDTNKVLHRVDIEISLKNNMFEFLT